MTGKAPKESDRVQMGYAYVIYSPRSGLYKLGSARRPLVRLAQLSREQCVKCALLHTIATNSALRLEREIQGRFLASMVAGEWFALDHSQVAIIQSVSSVFYSDAGQWRPRSNSRIDFDAGAAWARKLPICGSALI